MNGEMHPGSVGLVCYGGRMCPLPADPITRPIDPLELVAELRELRVRLDELAARLDELAARVAALEEPPAPPASP